MPTAEGMLDTQHSTLNTQHSIMIAPYPEADSALIDDQAERDWALVQELIVGLRNLRSEYKVEPAKYIAATIAAGERTGLLERQRALISRLARVGEHELLIAERIAQKPEGAAALVSWRSRGVCAARWHGRSRVPSARVCRRSSRPPKPMLRGVRRGLGNAGLCRQSAACCGAARTRWPRRRPRNRREAARAGRAAWLGLQQAKANFTWLSGASKLHVLCSYGIVSCSSFLAPALLRCFDWRDLCCVQGDA